MPRKTDVSILSAVIITLVVFFLTAHYTQLYLPELKSLIADYKILGLATYFLAAAVAIVIAPVSTLPLMPVAANLWGPFLTGVVSVAGWTLGSVVAFVLARRYGRPVVQRFVSLKKVKQLEQLLPDKNIFWTIVFLRVSIPVDILSYALGLFTTVRLPLFFWATLIGTTPFAFILAYVGTVPLEIQLAVFLTGALLFLIIVKTLKPRWWRVLTDQN